MVKDSAFQDGNNHLFCHEVSTGVKNDAFGASAEAKYNSSFYRYCGDVDLKLINGGVGAKAAANTIDGLKAKVEARCDLIDLEVGGFKSKFGISADTGGSIGPSGVEAKVAGIGIKFGKEIGVSLPFGEISFDLGKLF
ncbi:hypothetical protein C1646_674118 [Rhizophagus diaphanus]|nr:hypothetical protein C1646_674118 [Rhizophagus diaphanus] [Rhizophagus sp. MUCL 43196]